MGMQEIRKVQDPSVVVNVHSSIALLQERFRQLQKVKEMREERELVKLLSLTPTSCFFNTCLLFQPSSSLSTFLFSNDNPPQTSLSLSLPTSSQLPALHVPTLMDLWSPSSSSPSPPPPIHTTTTTSTTTSSFDTNVSFATKLNHDHDSDSDEDSDTDVDTSLHL